MEIERDTKIKETMTEMMIRREIKKRGRELEKMNFGSVDLGH